MWGRADADQKTSRPEIFGKQEEAIREFQNVLKLSGTEDMDVQLDLGFAFAVSGKQDEARRILIELEKLHEQGFVPSGSVAILHGASGESNEAFAWLEKAYEERDPQLTYKRDADSSHCVKIHDLNSLCAASGYPIKAVRLRPGLHSIARQMR